MNNMQNSMHKNTKSKRPDATWILIWSFVVVVLGSFAAVVILAYSRNNFAKKYILEVGNTIPGSTDVYVTSSERTVLLNESNHGSLATVLTSGSIYFKRKKDVLTGERLVITAVSKTDSTIRNYVYVEQKSDGKVRVTLENENGIMSASLMDVRYSAFIHLSALNTGNGENTEVDALP